MLQSRRENNISCKTCPVASLCMGGQLKEELNILDKIISYEAIFDKNVHVYFAQTKADNLYAVRSGYCKEYEVDIDGKEYVNDFYFPGDILGLNAISNRNYSHSVIALEKVHLCVIPLAQLVPLLGTTKELPMSLINIFANKINNDNSIRLSSSARQRVADFLLNLSSRFSKRGFSPYEFNLPIAQQDMSNKIGIAFETLSRILQTLRAQKVIEINSRHVQIKDIKKLRAMSGNWAAVG